MAQDFPLGPCGICTGTCTVSGASHTISINTVVPRGDDITHFIVKELHETIIFPSSSYAYAIRK